MKNYKVKSIGSSSVLVTQIFLGEKERNFINSHFSCLENIMLESGDSVLFGDQSSNKASLHLNPDFDPLTTNVEYFVEKYMNECGFCTQDLSLFHQKAWPVIIAAGQKVKSHSHLNCDLSVAICLRSELNHGGNLVFDSDDDYLRPGLIRGKALRGQLERSVYALKPIEGLLVVFPSRLKHFISEYTGIKPMYIVSYDVSIVGSILLGTGNSENFIIHAFFWREFSSRVDSSRLRQEFSLVKTDSGLDSENVVADLFDKHGYYVSDSFLPAQMCESLLNEVIHSWELGSTSSIKSPRFRLHTPIPLNDISLLVLKKICLTYRHLLEGYLALDDDKFLVELSSITSFPGAQMQAIHKNHIDTSHNLITFFVNLLQAGPSEGSIGVVPGSHTNITDCSKNERCQFLDLPPGSVVAMNGRLAHAGGANMSSSSIRPVWYCSFGSNNIHGPTHSITQELRYKYKYLDFLK